MANSEMDIDFGEFRRPREIVAWTAFKLSNFEDIYKVTAPEVGEITGRALEHLTKPGWLMITGNTESGERVLVVFQGY